MATLGQIVSARGGRWLCALGCCAGAIALWAALRPLPARSPAAAPPGLAQGVENAIARREYEASRNELGLQAPNRAHGLRTYFEPSVVRVHDRTAEGSPQLVQFELAAVGRGAERGVVEPGEVFAEGARVEIRRGELTEWYENSPRGLEQGFDLATRPPGDGELFLELKLSGVTAQAREGGLELRTATGRRLRYEKLAAHDANGRPVPARLELSEVSTVRFVVADAGAAYPLTIDPLLTATDDGLLQGAQAGAQLGVRVASAGDVNGDGFGDVIAGANLYDAGELDEGAAFVFLGSATGIGDATVSAAATQLEANQANALLGRSVAGAGDVNGDGYDDVIVGARMYDNGQTDEGIALIFLGSPAGIADGGPANAATLIQSNQNNGQLGMSVAGAGDVNGDGFADVVVGAWGYSAGQASEGIALIFLGSATGVANGTPVNAATRIEGNQAGANLGVTSAGAGDVNGDGYADVIVGSRIYDNGQTDEGAAFVFHGSATGIPNASPATANALIESDQAGGNLGWSLSGAGDVNGDGYSDVIVGALAYGAGQADEGIALVFHGSATGIASGNPTTANARIESNQVGAQLGSGVGAGDVNGDGYSDVIVGARFWDGGQTDEGAVFVFLGGSGGVGNGDPNNPYARLEADQANAHLGFDVAGAGDVNGDGYPDVVAGAELFDDAFVDSGAAFVFLGGNPGTRSGSTATAAALLDSDQFAAQLGISVAGAGDVNGDGFGDVIVGAPGYDSGSVPTGSGEGAAFLFQGSASGIGHGGPSTAATQLFGDQSGSLFGQSVAGAGDVNGDGYADVIVGAPNYDFEYLGPDGGAFVFHGSSAGIGSGGPSSAATQLSGSSSWSFGQIVAGAGDVNGDGYADVVVAAPAANLGTTGEGAAFIFLGGSSGIADGPSFSAATTLHSDQFGLGTGMSAASAGDVNGDGYSDVIVGLPRYDVPLLLLEEIIPDAGTALIYLGGPSGIPSGTPTSAATRIDGGYTGENVGRSVAGIGDADGDGFEDVAVGATGLTGAFVFGGTASGIASGTVSTARERFDFAGPGGFGASVAGAGDVNGDGRADLLVGAPTAGGTPFPGAAYLFFGLAIPQDRDTSEAAAQYTHPSGPGLLGSSVAGAGDIDGDGFADVIVGAYRYSDGPADEGGAFVFLGNGNRTGRPAGAEQLRPLPTVGRIGPGGLTGTTSTFRPGLYFTSPAGSFSARLEFEACAPGVAFGVPQCVRQLSPWYPLTGGSLFAHYADMTGLAPGTAYRWRGRVDYAPYSVVEAGITPPPNPAHGPWRRVNGDLVEAGVRTLPDADHDGFDDSVDNCPFLANPTQQDTDGDGVGSLCDLCPLVPDPTQPNFDGDVLGDGCDSDDDNDGLADASEPGYGTNPYDADSDDDGANDGFEANVLHTSPIDPDSDDDTALDGADNCPIVVNTDQIDADFDTRGNACDNCPRTANLDQVDSGGLNSPAPDGVGDVCQNGDWNGDGTSNIVDVVIIRQHLAGSQALDPRMPPEP